MPLFFRSLFLQSLKIIFCSTSGFVLLLLTLKVDQIAHFFSLGISLKTLSLFIAYQIPYFLPIAIPLSCLLATFLIIQTLSRQGTLTALRVGGLSLFAIFTPLLLAGGLCSLFNLLLVSDLAPNAHLKSNVLRREALSENPLFLLTNRSLVRNKKIYFSAKDSSQLKEYATDMVIAVPNYKERNLSLLVGKKIAFSPASIEADSLSLITSFTNPEMEADNFLIENVRKLKMPTFNLNELVEVEKWTIPSDYLSIPFLLARLKAQKKEHNKNDVSFFESSKEVIIEITKRFSIAVSAITFTLLGFSFGLNISRTFSKKNLLILLFLTGNYLVCFFIAPRFSAIAIISTLYFLPHLLIVYTSIWQLKRINKGIN